MIRIRRRIKIRIRIRKMIRRRRRIQTIKRRGRARSSMDAECGGGGTTAMRSSAEVVVCELVSRCCHDAWSSWTGRSPLLPTFKPAW